MRALVLPGVPTPMCVTPFCSSFTCSSTCVETTQIQLFCYNHHGLRLCAASWSNWYLDVFCKKFHNFSFTLESSQLSEKQNPNNSFNSRLNQRKSKSLGHRLLDELNGSKSGAADDEDNHWAFLCVLLLDLCPLGTNLGNKKKAIKVKYVSVEANIWKRSQHS